MRNSRSKNPKGNMLVLTGMSMSFVCLLLLIACSFGGLVFVQTRLQTSANEIALAGALTLNKADRIGEMNNMVARSRQMVFSSHDNMDKVDDSLRHLAEQLYQESVDSANQLNSVDREHLLQVSTDEANSAMQAKLAEVSPSYSLKLPWLEIGTPVMHATRLGKLKDIKSNVWSLTEIEEVATHDASSSYLQNGLYKDDIDAHILHDEGIHFKMSSLPAPVEHSIGPARQALASSFLPSEPDQLHSATQVEIEIPVKTIIGSSAATTMRATGTAITTGGGDQQ